MYRSDIFIEIKDKFNLSTTGERFAMRFLYLCFVRFFCKHDVEKWRKITRILNWDKFNSTFSFWIRSMQVISIFQKLLHDLRDSMNFYILSSVILRCLKSFFAREINIKKFLLHCLDWEIYKLVNIMQSRLSSKVGMWKLYHCKYFFIHHTNHALLKF